MSTLNPRNRAIAMVVDALVILAGWQLMYLFRLGFERWQPGRPPYDDAVAAGVALCSLIFLAVTGVNATLPVLLGDHAPGDITQSILMLAVLFLMQLGCTAIALRQLKKLDLLRSYIVADNWATFFLGLFSSALAAAGVGGVYVMLALAVLVIIVEVNIARLILGLTPLQIAMLLVAQLVGVWIGLSVIGAFIPLAADIASPFGT